MNPETNIDDLPREIFMAIINDLDEADIVMVSFSCKKWNNLMIEEISELFEMQNELTKHAAYLGYISILKWAKSNNHRWSDLTAPYAAQGGHLDILKWLLGEEDSHWNRTVSNFAAYGGQLEVLKWLVTVGLSHRFHSHFWFKPCDSQTAYFAAKTGQLEVIQWLHKNNYMRTHVISYSDQSTDEISEAAAKGGHLKILQWIKSEYQRIEGFYCIAGAAKGGQIEILEWLKENNCILNRYAYIAAARKGRLAVLKWLYANGCQLNKKKLNQIVDLAIIRNDQEIFEWSQSIIATK